MAMTPARTVQYKVRRRRRTLPPTPSDSDDGGGGGAHDNKAYVEEEEDETRNASSASTHQTSSTSPTSANATTITTHNETIIPAANTSHSRQHVAVATIAYSSELQVHSATATRTNDTLMMPPLSPYNRWSVTSEAGSGAYEVPPVLSNVYERLIAAADRRSAASSTSSTAAAYASLRLPVSGEQRAELAAGERWSELAADPRRASR